MMKQYLINDMTILEQLLTRGAISLEELFCFKQIAILLL